MSPGGVKTPMESLTTIWQAGGGTFGIGVALNTQLVAGAATSTTESGAVCAPEGAQTIPAAAMTATCNVIFTVICLRSKKYRRSVLVYTPKNCIPAVTAQQPAIPIASS